MSALLTLFTFKLLYNDSEMHHFIFLLSAWLMSAVTGGVINGGIKCTLYLRYLDQYYSKCNKSVKTTCVIFVPWVEPNGSAKNNFQTGYSVWNTGTFILRVTNRFFCEVCYNIWVRLWNIILSQKYGLKSCLYNHSKSSFQTYFRTF